MRIAVFGFKGAEEIDSAVWGLVEEGFLPMLFSVACVNAESAIYKWAESNGVPVVRCRDLDEITKVADFVILKRDGCPQELKNAAMKMKTEGKHGRFVG